MVFYKPPSLSYVEKVEVQSKVLARDKPPVRAHYALGRAIRVEIGFTLVVHPTISMTCTERY